VIRPGDVQVSPAGELEAQLAPYIEQGVLPAAAIRKPAAAVVDRAVTDPDLAARLAGLCPARQAPDRPGERLLAEALTETDPTIRAERVRAAFSRMPPDGAEWMPVIFAGAVGNLRGAPFRHRVTANRIRLAAELGRHHSGRYELLLRERRQVLLFGPTDDPRGDPEGEGRLIELHGTLGPDTRNIAVVVPGSGAEIGVYDLLKAPIDSLVEAAGGSLAIIVWMNGELPGALPAAVLARYAAALAPRLAGFIPEVRQELAHATPGHAADVKITVAGHSYGGAVVGAAERLGLDANRILHVASAGMGGGVRSPADYRNPNRDVQRFSMTAPGDPIRSAAGRAGAPRWTEAGANPDTFPGVIRLETGRYPDAAHLGDRAGRPLAGIAAHREVWTPECEAWRNIFNVLTGGRVTLWRGPGETERPRSGDPPALDVV
jgi:hypothetical protein